VSINRFALQRAGHAKLKRKFCNIKKNVPRFVKLAAEVEARHVQQRRV
jgi:hypothetical protein